MNEPQHHIRYLRAMLGNTTREAVRAQLSEESLKNSQSRTNAPSAALPVEEPQIVDMTPNFVQDVYGLYHIPLAPLGVSEWRRVKSNRFTVDDLRESPSK